MKQNSGNKYYKFMKKNYKKWIITELTILLKIKYVEFVSKYK